MEVRRKFTLDVNQRSPLEYIFAKQGDTKSRFLEITLTNNGLQLNIPSTSTVRLQLKKTDGHTVYNDGYMESGKIIVELTEQALAIGGIAVAEIAVYDGAALITSQIFYLKVDNSAFLGSEVTSSDEFKAFIDAMLRIELAGNISQTAKTNSEIALANLAKFETALNTSKANADTATAKANQAADKAEAATETATNAAKNQMAMAETLAIKPQVSGETVRVTDSAEWRLQVITIDGKSEQKVTSQGKNLFNIHGYSVAKTTTVSGVTFTLQDDGGVRRQGTATALATFGTNEFNLVNVCEIGKRYTASGMTLEIVYNDGTANWYGSSFVMSSNMKKVNIYTQVGSGITVNDVIYPQLEEGATATAYEPFTPDSPSPGYVAEISSPKEFDLTIANNMGIRYVRDCLKGSNVDRSCIWVQGRVTNTKGVIISNGIMPTINFTFSDVPGSRVSPERYTDGNINQSPIVHSVGDSNAWHYIQLDLGRIYYDIATIKVWHMSGRNFNHMLQVSTDGVTWMNLFDSGVQGTYTETTEGHAVETANDYRSINITLADPLKSFPGGIKDVLTLDFRNKVATRVNRVKRLMLHNAGLWYIYARGTGEDFTVFMTPVANDSKVGYQVSICSHFKNISAVWDAPTKSCFSDHYTTTDKYFMIKNSVVGIIGTDSETEKIAKWKTYLAGTPITLDYLLANPTTTEIPWDPEWDKLKMYYGETAVITEPATNLSLEYVADTELYMDNKMDNKIKELAAAIVAGGGL